MGLTLKDLFILERILKEETIRLSEDSLDSQIDSVLLRYQEEASLEDNELEDAGLNEGYKMPENWKLLLKEAEGDEEEETPMSGDDIMSVGDDMPRASKPSDPKQQKLNIDDFAQKVSNLYEHYDSLLNVKPVIVHRAMHLLEKGYPADLIQEFLEILEREFGITLEGDKEEEPGAAPFGGSPGPVGVG
jgi:hypothetical protein